MINNKRGQEFMLKHVISFMVGLFVLVMLFYGLSTTYNLLQGDEKERDAGNSAEMIIDKLEDLSLNEETNHTLLKPKGWYIISYKPSSEELPNECIGRNCLCICPAKRILGTIRTGVNCDKGICNYLGKEIKITGEIKIPEDITLKSSNQIYEISKKEESE